MERHAARDEELHGRRHRGDNRRCDFEHVLEVVEQEQEPPVAQVAGKSLADVSATLGNAKGPSNSREDEAGIRERGKVDEEDSVREIVEELGRDVCG